MPNWKSKNGRHAVGIGRQKYVEGGTVMQVSMTKEDLQRINDFVNEHGFVEDKKGNLWFNLNVLPSKYTSKMKTHNVYINPLGTKADFKAQKSEEKYKEEVHKPQTDTEKEDEWMD